MPSYKNNGAGNGWSEMLHDILEEISDRLPLLDFFVFRGVCRGWRSAPSGRSEITSFSKDTPWLMFYGSDGSNVHAGGVCYLYNSPRPKRCTFRLPHLCGATVLQSKSGWLFAHRNEHFFLYNPFTLAKIDLPDHKVCDEQDATMTTPPTDCGGSLVFIVSRKNDSTVEVSSCRTGDAEWENRSVGIEKDEIGATLAVYPCHCIETNNGSDARPSTTHCPRCRSSDRKSILIHGSKRNSLYEYVQNKQTYCDMRNDDSREYHDQFWHDDFEDSCHRESWLRTYGEESILVSTCMLSTRAIPGAIGLRRATRVVAEEGDGGTDEELKLVRASWIEPIFG